MKNPVAMRVPNHQPRDRWQRFLELITGVLPFLFLALVIILSRYFLTAAAVLLLVYTLAWLIRLLGYTYRQAVSLYYLQLASLIDWQTKLTDVMAALSRPATVTGFWRKRAEKWYATVLAGAPQPETRLDSAGIYHAVIIAVYNETAEIVDATLKSVAASAYDPQRLLVVVAYEERGGPAVEAAVSALMRRYRTTFKLATAIKHPDNLPREAKVKAANITYAAKYISGYCARHNILPEQVLVTTLDADNRPHRQYFAALAWTYALVEARTRRSYQPIPLFTNNIWDVPAIVRVLAADSSFWFMIGALQPQRLRLFSAHAQSLKTLQDTNYWNVEVVVEDGHQYWRTYFTYDGDHVALPIWLPIYQDAVQSETYWRTLVAQFRQLRRWSWGVADTPWLVRQAWRDKRIGWPNKLLHIVYQLDDYIAWSTAPIVLSVGGWLPLLLSPHAHDSMLALRLPYVIGGLQALALIGLVVLAAGNLMSLPPRPARYGPSRNVLMVLQWALEPVALIGFLSMASLNAHWRLIVNKPLETFHVTEKRRRH